MQFSMNEKNKITAFYVDEQAEKGILRVADKVVADVNSVTGGAYEVKKATSLTQLLGDSVVLFANSEKSQLVAELVNLGKIDLKEITGKWEVFGQFVLENPWDGAGKVLVITGSDKRGTIYGMFDLSEKIGVSPMCYISDSVIPHVENPVLDLPAAFVSKEPSVQFRGFFINDEWPCFGNWTFEHFEGFNAKMYDHIFELLLRLKGNYFWPAMWTSSFALDGPGEESYILADEYGVVIGNSHHEPCLRASEEWDKVRGEDSIYGNAWNFLVNREGLLKYWEDGLARSAKLESMVTIGMRGERDSKVMGEDATLKDNIDLLKDIIHCQKELIAVEEKKCGKTLPKLLALYKEVEPYFYGDEKTEGLCDWDELSDVILMLCEDNHGYLRTIPDEKMRQHKGGYGMYYHVDYHGGPISYEWLNSSPISVMWEQMSKAYNTGVQKVWILNVGDLKFNEFPLSYFMNLAFDFEKYGSSRPGNEQEYTEDLLAKHLGGTLTTEQVKEGAEILTETVRVAGLRRPEALNPSIYHPFHYGEADRMIERVKKLSEREKAFSEKLSQMGEAYVEAWESLIGYETKCIVNHVLLNVYAAKNEALAKQGRKEANMYGDLYQQCIAQDRAYAASFKQFKGGKWSGMEKAAHVGFTKWNEDGCKYPVRCVVEPFDRPRMLVSYNESDRVYDKVYGSPMRIFVSDFCYEEVENVKITVSNTGIGSMNVKVIMPECAWLKADFTEGTVEECKEITFTCDRAAVTGEDSALVTFTDGDTTVEAMFTVKKWAQDLKAGTFLPARGGIVMDAIHFADAKVPAGSTLVKMEDYGIVGSAVKFYPDEALYERGAEPSLSYEFYSDKAGELVAEIWFAPSNPMTREGRMEYAVAMNGEKPNYVNVVPAGYRAGENDDSTWCRATLDHRHVNKVNVNVKEGTNTMEVLLRDAGIVLERIMIYAPQNAPKRSYLGPQESVRR